MSVRLSDYAGSLSEQATLRVSAVAHVHETDQIFAESTETRLGVPAIDVQAESGARVGRPLRLYLCFQVPTLSSFGSEQG